MSFWELVVVAVVALVVLGPEKLPGAIRSVSRFISGIKQFGQQMKAELSDELRAHELHQKLKEAEEKGLLGLTSEEMAAIAELRQAAAEVNNPYGHAQVAKPSTSEPAAQPNIAELNIAEPNIADAKIAQPNLAESTITQPKLAQNETPPTVTASTGPTTEMMQQQSTATPSPQLVSQEPHERKNPA